MKVKKANTSGEWKEEGQSCSQGPEVAQKDRAGKKWYEYIPYDKIRDKVPLLRNIRGGKKELRFWTFHETWEEGQILFDHNPAFFRTRNQVDLSAHYIGMRVLFELHKKGIPRSSLSEILEEEEKNFILFDKMKSIKESFKKLVELHVEGFVEDEELDSKAFKFISSFKQEKNRIKVARMLDLMMEKGEVQKAGDRVRQRKHRDYEKKLKENK